MMNPCKIEHQNRFANDYKPLRWKWSSSIFMHAIFLGALLFTQCKSSETQPPPTEDEVEEQVMEHVLPTVPKVQTGADQLTLLLPKLSGQRVSLVVNHTSLVGKTHLADTLLKLGVNVVSIMGPEHGFRGNAADGEQVKDGIDSKTGLPVISLYGKNYKPTAAQIANVDLLIFDIQDVGARFYTYISTLHYVMEAAAENNKKILVLDRPNPHGAYIDGPLRDSAFKSFVGMHPIPVVHGLTVGELARMINGEKWLANEKMCDLEVILLKNWTHADSYVLPVKPSPNLPNQQAINLYPSLCLFEGTVISVGRGTSMPFQIIGNPELKDFGFQFIPKSIPGVTNNPPFENVVCYGINLENALVENKIALQYLIDLYQAYPHKEKFFTPYFDKLAGTDVLKEQLIKGMNEKDIRESWQPDLDAFQLKRKKYLLYP